MTAGAKNRYRYGKVSLECAFSIFFSLTATDKKEKFLNFDYSAWADIKLRFSLNRLHFWFCGNSDSVFDLLPRLEMKKKFSLFDTAFEHPTTKRLQFNVPIKSKVVATFNLSMNNRCSWWNLRLQVDQPLRYVSRLSRGSGSIQKYVPFVITKKKKHKNLGKKIYVKQLNT